ncbi:MAG TPA: hypothetical protein VJC05_02770 [Candidatus Andersenbacteria bacterium]|nr:hypothetical protein [Candidatus Andersenbacteria bacterium]
MRKRLQFSLASLLLIPLWIAIFFWFAKGGPAHVSYWWYAQQCDFSTEADMTGDEIVGTAACSRGPWFFDSYGLAGKAGHWLTLYHSLPVCTTSDGVNNLGCRHKWKIPHDVPCPHGDIEFDGGTLHVLDGGLAWMRYCFSKLAAR